MTDHYHHGYGSTGYGPDEPQTCLTLDCLAECVRTELDAIGDMWADQAHGERYQVEQMRKLRPDNGSDPIGYPGSWESIATAATRALECLDYAEACEDRRQGLSSERRHAPMYRQDLSAWQTELRRLLLDSGTYPLTTDIEGYHRFYVWSCGGWECLLNEHDSGYALPVGCLSSNGGYVPCACRDCVEVTVWSPIDGGAPYCDACRDAGCPDRHRGECEAA